MRAGGEFAPSVLVSFALHCIIKPSVQAGRRRGVFVRDANCANQRGQADRTSGSEQEAWLKAGETRLTLVSFQKELGRLNCGGFLTVVLLWRSAKRNIGRRAG